MHTWGKYFQKTGQDECWRSCGRTMLEGITHPATSSHWEPPLLSSLATHYRHWGTILGAILAGLSIWWGLLSLRSACSPHACDTAFRWNVLQNVATWWPQMPNRLHACTAWATRLLRTLAVKTSFRRPKVKNHTGTLEHLWEKGASTAFCVLRLLLTCSQYLSIFINFYFILAITTKLVRNLPRIT